MNIALFGIALGLVVMILSVAIVTGFKKEVGRKVVGFGSHLQIVNLDSNQSYETQPISRKQPFLDKLRKVGGVKHVQVFATKPGVIHTDEQMMGLVLKGVGPDFDWSFFRENLIEGEPFAVGDSARSNKIWISKQVAADLKVKLGDKVDMFFLNGEEVVPRSRRFEVCGIYKTSLEEFDRLFALVDIGHIQRLNNWTDDQVSGFEVLVDDINQLDIQEKEIKNLLVSYMVENGPVLQVVSIKSKYNQIFDWLSLLDMNVWVILGLMVVVAGFNMVSGLLVIILERVQMIGILKAMGLPEANLRKIFLYFSGMLILKAMVWGNILGLAACLVQYYFHVVKLDPASYYVDHVAINLSWGLFLLVNIGTILTTLLMLVGPSFLISRISPEKTIRFE